ncbi:MFS polyamine transporter [Cyathus striatus]|nr:MFS polyamine transporter [Cyathus striatus]
MTPSSLEHVSVAPLEDIQEPALDPRLSLDSHELHQKPSHLTHQPSTGTIVDHGAGNSSGSKKEKDLEKSQVEVQVMKNSGPIYIDWEHGDPRNPANFPRSKKWVITAVACFSTLIACYGSMTRDLQCSVFQATIGLAVYCLGFGVVPLVSASFSEEFGRQPLFYPDVFDDSLTVIVARFLQGAFGSTAATMVGGTVADLWSAKERGLPMSLFAIAGVGGNGLGPFIAGLIEGNPKLEWKWIEWILMIITGLYLVLLVAFLRETRASVILTHIAKNIRKETGDSRYRARVEDERASLRTLIWISCTRPVYLMFTEPVVASFSLWIGFAWGVTYVFVQSISGVFRNLHHFSVSEIGCVFLSVFIGTIIGFILNYYQEYLYRENLPERGPEARLYSACAVAIVFPVSMFVYAWCSFSHVHWIALAISITTKQLFKVFMVAVFTMYLAVFSYLADWKHYSNNFPAVHKPYVRAIDYKWANTLFGCIAALMIPIPYVLFFYGPQIRMKILDFVDTHK